MTLNESIDELTVQYEEDGKTVLKELDKVILSKGAWTTILFRYQEWRPQVDDFGPDKYTIRRFTISSADQARKIIDALERWMGERESE